MEYIIRTKGELINSPRPDRRKFYVAALRDGVEVSVQEITKVLSYAVGKLRGARTTDRDVWWQYRQCKYCLAQAEKIMTMHGCLPNNWRSRYCLRHGAIEFIRHINVIDNKERWYKLIIDGRNMEVEEIYVNLSSIKHSVLYYINAVKKYATVTLDNKFKFMYKLHLNAYPLASSFQHLCELLSYVILELLFVVEKHIPEDINVFFNSKLLYKAT